jgi:hypothetical protein
MTAAYDTLVVNRNPTKENIMTTATPNFFESLETSIETAVSGWIATAKADAIAIFKKEEPIIEASAEELASFALQAVVTQGSAALTGSEKLSAAVQNVVSSVAASGKTVAITDATTAVQAVFDKLTNAATALGTAATAA